ncbi:hypothetical protein GCM10011608_59680 [Micromonospora sonchi]|uniref:Uncharacterized protein n=1 Tax=Micromonospora sonchi TaxID=1763543 RepID=A0A917X5B8_9ACTN|nr:hypothetical protein [Micromonospora sonchi]GGM66498.1 hypothetical protein GCM10011608_59680 [Micromonospora sonchi]
MTIFSAITRTDPSPAVHGDGRFKFLDRVSGAYWDQIRDLIEDWFSRLCPDAQADVRGRLRSKDDRQFSGAFFELYLHECLLRMGYTVTCHPVLEGTTRRPDFLAEKDGRSIYVEARSASDSDVAVGAAARINAVYESLNRLDSPNFSLWIEVVRQGLGPLRAKPLRGRLERWLSGLDPDKVKLGGRRDDLPSHLYEEQTEGDDVGWIIEFWAIPKSSEARGREGVRPLGIFGGNAARVNDEVGILGALSDKGAAYGPLGAPFIVAVASSSMSLDDHDVYNALYGTEMLQITTAPDGTESHAVVREANGYWYAGDNWDHRRVSAVLVVKQLHPAFVGNQQHTIWEHPDPEHAVEALPMWRRAILGADSQMEFIDSPRAQTDWFGLGNPWPKGEPFPRQA